MLLGKKVSFHQFMSLLLDEKLIPRGVNVIVFGNLVLIYDGRHVAILMNADDPSCNKLIMKEGRIALHCLISKLLGTETKDGLIPY